MLSWLWLASEAGLDLRGGAAFLAVHHAPHAHLAPRQHAAPARLIARQGRGGEGREGGHGGASGSRVASQGASLRSRGKRGLARKKRFGRRVCFRAFAPPRGGLRLHEHQLAGSTRFRRDGTGRRLRCCCSPGLALARGGYVILCHRSSVIGSRAWIFCAARLASCLRRASSSLRRASVSSRTERSISPRRLRSMHRHATRARAPSRHCTVQVRGRRGKHPAGGSPKRPKTREQATEKTGRNRHGGGSRGAGEQGSRGAGRGGVCFDAPHVAMLLIGLAVRRERRGQACARRRGRPRLRPRWLPVPGSAECWLPAAAWRN